VIAGSVADVPIHLAEAILEQIADAVILVDTTGTIRRWNRAAP
jgi:hypothetical protein